LSQEDVMDSNSIYRKTEQGADAMATRNAALGPRQRSVLILVDGRRTHGELAALAGAWGDPEQLIKGLLEQGFIEQLAPATTPAQPAAAAPTGAASATVDTPGAVPLAQAQRQAVRRLNDILGPSAESLCLRLESARTGEEFRAALARAETFLRGAAGPAKAAQFMEEMAGFRPA
jgi:hypothetical protein